MENLESIRMTFPYNINNFDLAQSFVREIAKKIGFSGTSLDQIDIAVEVVVPFIMNQTYDSEESKTFDIICQKIEQGMKILIKDMGMPFDPRTVARFNVTKNIEDMEMEGIGLYLMQKMLDDLEFRNLGHLGKEIMMVKYLPQEDRQEQEPAGDTHMMEDAAAISEKIDFEVRRMMPEEAIEVSRCAYKSHGFSFFDEHIYYPERLVEMNRSLEMISAVAVTRENDLMGHAALVFQNPEDTIAEFTFAFVNIEYRGQGALNRLTEFLLQVPKKRKLTGIYSYAVAVHPYTQKSLAKYSLKDFGILLATSPASWRFKGISDDTSQRISVVLSFRYMREPVGLTLYPPAHHREMISRLYESLGAAHHYHQPESLEPVFKASQAEIHVAVNEMEGCAVIYVLNYGENILKLIRRTLRELCVQHISCIDMLIKLTDPLTYHLTSEFEQMGFFFAGILPDSRIGDGLILQYLNNVGFNYDKVVIYQDFTKEMLAYVRAHDPNETI
ncbi:MAG TPA: ATP-binding protein [Bacteroidales bacterium]|nr:ATP-binding protein [Bacteroidales bacterium]HRZ20116.1 ATP-binding protein [Bacteroidales bacterium]